MPDKEKPTNKSGAPSTPPAGTDPATGVALRSVYQQTVEERIPDEMLDLLGKLS